MSANSNLHYSRLNTWKSTFNDEKKFTYVYISMQNIQQIMLNHKVKLAEQITGHHGPTFACKHWFEHLYFRPTWTGSPTHIKPSKTTIHTVSLAKHFQHILSGFVLKCYPSAISSSGEEFSTFLSYSGENLPSDSNENKVFSAKKKKKRTLNCKNNTALERDSSTGKECSLLRGWKKNMCVHAGIDICSIDLCLAEQTKDNR